jgi:Tfp pilus assembly protein PilF
MALSGVILSFTLTACQPLPILPNQRVPMTPQLAYVQLAEGYLDAGLLLQAEQAAEQASRHRPDHPRVGGLWARLAALRGDHATAEALFARHASSDLWVAHQFGSYLLARQRPTDALVYLTSVTTARTYPARAHAWRETARAFEMLAQLEAADHAYGQRRRLRPTDPEAVADWILIAARRGRTAELDERIHQAQSDVEVQLDWDSLFAEVGQIQARFQVLRDGFGVMKH